MSAVSLVCQERQWFKSQVGLDVCQTDRDISFCQHCITDYKPFNVYDATQDERFKDNPLVTGEPYIRFYYGAPLTSQSGHNIGTLCVIDSQPRELTDSQVKAMDVLAEHVMLLLERRRELIEMEAAVNEVNILDQNHLMQSTISRLKDIVIITSPGPTAFPGPEIIFVNDAFVSKTGYARDEVVGQPITILHGANTSQEELEKIWYAMSHGEPSWAEIINYSKDGDAYWVNCHISPVRDNQGNIRQWISIEQDITNQKNAESQIESLAYYDPLTRLPNRQYLQERLEVLRKPSGIDMYHAVLFLDLDDFKRINDTLGHDTGDELLKQVGERIQTTVRDSDLVARFGGDEFIVLLERIADQADKAIERASAIANKLLEACNETYLLGESEYYLMPSIGIALIDKHSGEKTRGYNQAGRYCHVYCERAWQEQRPHF